MRPVLLAAFFAAVAGAGLSAQGRPEVRADAIISEKAAGYAGAGILYPLGTYLRAGPVGAVGIADGSASYRAELEGLFHLDPFRESRWGPYAGGGLSFRHDSSNPRGNVYLFAVIGAEGSQRPGYSPALEIGLGGGVRLSIILRRAGGRVR